MIRADIHLHTSFSSDCDEEMENVIQAGIDRGLDIMCFTEHMDKDYPIEGQFILDCEAYRNRYLELRDKYRRKSHCCGVLNLAFFHGLRIGIVVM